jgi:hypothetical protein
MDLDLDIPRVKGHLSSALMSELFMLCVQIVCGLAPKIVLAGWQSSHASMQVVIPHVIADWSLWRHR